MIRYIYHRLPFEKWYSKKNTTTLITDLKTKKLNVIEIKLENLYTPLTVRDLILANLNNIYYESIRNVNESSAYPFSTNIAFNLCNNIQNLIGWGHFIWGVITKKYHITIQIYYRVNKFDLKFKSSFWFCFLIPFF